MISFSVAANFRDLGGLPASDGRVIVHGRIYRSAAPYELAPDDLALRNSASHHPR